MKRRNTWAYLVTTAWLPLLLSSAAPTLPSLSAAQLPVVLPAPDDAGATASQQAAVRPGQPAAVPADGFRRASLAPTGKAGLLAPGVGTAAPHDLPYVALLAYQRAARVLAKADPTCGLRWPVLAAIGRVESDHGRYAAATPGADGVSRPLIVGPALDGRGPVARIRDTDGGRWDGDPRWDRAVGPMQIIPSTWSLVGVDGDADGVRSPHDVDDAALAAGVYLCAGPDSLTSSETLAAAIGRYNRSAAYVALVMTYVDQYASGRFAVELDHPSFASVPLDLRAVPIADEAPEDRTAELASDPGGRADKRAGKPGKDRDDAPTKAGRPPAAPAAAVDRPAPDAQASGVPEGANEQLAEVPRGEVPVTEPPTTQTAATSTPAPEDVPGPEPSTDPDPDPGPDPDTETEAEEPAPVPEPATPSSSTDSSLPATTTLTGLWATCDAGWCVDDRAVLLPAGSTPDQTATSDLDEDGVVETLAEELAGREGTTVTVEVEQGTGVWVLVLA